MHVKAIIYYSSALDLILLTVLLRFLRLIICVVFIDEDEGARSVEAISKAFSTLSNFYWLLKYFFCN